MPAKKEVERAISQAIIRFEKEFMGRGPLDVKTYIAEDWILVRLKNVLTPAELKLAESENPERGTVSDQTDAAGADRAGSPAARRGHQRHPAYQCLEPAY